jgi:hypothetical protein
MTPAMDGVGWMGTYHTPTSVPKSHLLGASESSKLGRCAEVCWGLAPAFERRAIPHGCHGFERAGGPLKAS